MSQQNDRCTEPTENPGQKSGGEEHGTTGVTPTGPTHGAQARIPTGKVTDTRAK